MYKLMCFSAHSDIVSHTVITFFSYVILALMLGEEEIPEMLHTA
jgi:hypothetical protein